MLTLMGKILTNNSNILAHCKLLRTQRIQPNLIEIYDNGFRQTQDCSQGQSVPKTASQKKPQSGKNWFKLATKKIHKICFNRAENSSKIPFGRLTKCLIKQSHKKT